MARPKKEIKIAAEPVDNIGKPWAKIPGESSLRYGRFVAYLKLGTKRSVKKMLDTEGINTSSALNNWSHIASAMRWRERAEAYDSDHLMEELAQRATQREEARQYAYDEAAAALYELRELSQGRMQPGDVRPICDKSGEPRYMIVQDPKTKMEIEVPIVEEVVKPEIRRKALEKILGLAGIVEPRRSEISIVDDSARDSMRDQIRTLDPETLAALADALGVER